MYKYFPHLSRKRGKFTITSGNTSIFVKRGKKDICRLFRGYKLLHLYLLIGFKTREWTRGMLLLSSACVWESRPLEGKWWFHRASLTLGTGQQTFCFFLVHFNASGKSCVENKQTKFMFFKLKCKMLLIISVKSQDIKQFTGKTGRKIKTVRSNVYVTIFSFR